jgi:hypothetical protein
MVGAFDERNSFEGFGHSDALSDQGIVGSAGAEGASVD